MPLKKSFYITTTLPYVNADPHVGFAMEIIRADAVARYKKLSNFDVFFNTGTDEHGLKIYRKAEEQKIPPQEYADDYAAKFRELIPALHISKDIHFIRTTDPHHIKAAQEFWRRCKAKGDIYKKTYKIKYCVGCEMEKTESEIENGHCILHPNLDLEIIEEENYFFKFSNYQKPLLEYYKKNPAFVIPNFRFNEIKAFVERGLEDFSISRLKTKMPWGIPVPDDQDHVMYVWFDALINYISTIGWPEDEKTFKTYWMNGTPVQYCGKDNLRQQSAMWQAMLMSAGLPNSAHIIINGFITSGGQKMSKSVGNVINPFDIVKEYGAEALRYYLLREISSFEDGDFTAEGFKAAYNASLANGLGNLTSRILKMATSYGVTLESASQKPIEKHIKQDKKNFDSFNLKVVMDDIWSEINEVDAFIQKNEPFKTIKTNPDKAKSDVAALLAHLYDISTRLLPLMPETAKTIQTLIVENKMPEKPLFARKD